MLAVTITGTYGMDDILAGQMIAFCDFGRASFTTAKRLTFSQQLRSCCAMNAAVHATITEKGCVGSIDDCIYLHLRNVVSDNL